MLRISKLKQAAHVVLGVVYIFAVTILALLLRVNTVQAAPSVCYWTMSTDEAYAEVVDCSQASMSTMIELVHGQVEAEGFCYSLHRTGGVPQKYALGGAECNALAQKAGASQTAETKCWTLRAPISAYDDLNFYYSDIEGGDHPCTAAENELIEEKYVLASEPGFCYVFSNVDRDEVRRATCVYLFSVILAANVNAQTSSGVGALPTDVDRDEVAECDGSGSEAALEECLRKNPIVNIIVWVINLLSAGAGVIITMMIVMGGIQYSTAGANPQAVGAAKGKIFNAIIALLMLIFLYSFLEWLVPGGPF